MGRLTLEEEIGDATDDIASSSSRRFLDRYFIVGFIFHFLGHFMAKPMPSAGIIPLLQSFCPNANSHVDKHGFIDFPSAR